MTHIEWFCHACGQQASNGAIHIDLQKVRAAERRLADWNSRPREAGTTVFNVADIFAMPTVESWQVTCGACLHDCAGCYAIDLGRCQSLAALIRWTAHLYDKNWFNATNWISFIRRVAQDNGSPNEAVGVW